MFAYEREEVVCLYMHRYEYTCILYMNIYMYIHIYVGIIGGEQSVRHTL
jgi:hypothetical protein